MTTCTACAPSTEKSTTSTAAGPNGIARRALELLHTGFHGDLQIPDPYNKEQPLWPPPQLTPSAATGSGHAGEP